MRKTIENNEKWIVYRVENSWRLEPEFNEIRWNQSIGNASSSMKTIQDLTSLYKNQSSLIGISS